ncbi:MAG: penicillin-binding protein 2 [Proteobacteria bacterium]|nr:penicillin-binding protein 2 [Pseudomonadota bacterium]
MSRGAETKEQIARRFVARSVFVWVFFAFAAISLLARAVHLQVLNKDFLNQQADTRHLRIEKISAHRGSITDRNGEPLAISTPVDSVWANPRKLATAVDRVGQLADALQLDAQALMRKITRSMDKEFIYLKRHLDPDQAHRVMALKLPGVNVQREYRRYYPSGEVTGHLVGFTNIDDDGQEGLELAFNHWLSGESGAKRVLKDRLGRSVEDVESIRPSRPGQDLRTSIDLRLQYLAYRTLKAAIQRFNADSGSIVMLDVRTGEVLAMVNQPTYNPNDRSQYSAARYRNRAITDIFEPGSTIKAFTIAAALETGIYSIDTVIETSPGWMMVSGNTIRDIFNYGTLTVEKVITKSSNIGASKIALSIGAEPIRDLLERVGFGQVTGTGFPGERSGVLPNPRRWSRIGTATLSYGYGLSVSALQLAQAYSVIADGGIKKPVTLLKLDAESVEALPRERVLSALISRQVLAALETVVDKSRGGAVLGANIPFYSVAGKSGTTHVVGPFGYEENLHNSLFVGLVPASDPRLVIVVVINEPKGEEHYGGQVAAPVFSRIAAGAMRLLNVSPDKIPVKPSRELRSLSP